MRKSIAIALAAGALLAIPFTATAASAATHGGVSAITGTWVGEQQEIDELIVNEDGSFFTSGMINCAGTADETGTNTYVFRMTCTGLEGETWFEEAGGELDDQVQGLAIDFSTGPASFHRG